MFPKVAVHHNSTHIPPVKELFTELPQGGSRNEHVYSPVLPHSIPGYGLSHSIYLGNRAPALETHGLPIPPQDNSSFAKSERPVEQVAFNAVSRNIFPTVDSEETNPLSIPSRVGLSPRDEIKCDDHFAFAASPLIASRQADLFRLSSEYATRQPRITPKYSLETLGYTHVLFTTCAGLSISER